MQEKYDYERRKRKTRCNVGEGINVNVPADDMPEPSIRDQGWDCDKLNEYLK